MPTYDTEFYDPPAPLARVTLRHPDNGAVLNGVPMLIDTGADVSLVPEAYIRKLGIPFDATSSYSLMGFDGEISEAMAVRTELLFLGKVYKGRFLVLEQEWGVIGRNILNTLPLLLNGPKLMWTEHKS
jgi:predicted aspartyl protease